MRYILAIILSVWASCALAQPAPNTPGYTTNGTNWIAVSPTTGLPVIDSGFDSGPIVATATPANSSHAAGTSIGGLFSLPLARVNGGSGIATNFAWKSVGGDTGQKLYRIWSKNPVNTTCTDNVAFAGSDTDDAFLITPPFALTPAAPAVTTGDSATYAGQSVVTWDYKNVDTTPTQNLYICVVNGATADTADQNKIVRVMMSGPQN